MLELRWLAAGTAWSMDFTRPHPPLAGRDRRVFVVRDLASGATMKGAPCIGERATVVVATLPRLFQKHGAPLVMKHDNGSAFRSGATQALLKAFKVTSLPSPPHCPRYNGAVESGMGPIKDFAQAQAATHGHPDLLTVDDIESACRTWNLFDVRRDGKWTTRAAAFASRARIPESAREQLLSQFRDRFRVVARDLGLDPNTPMEWWTWGKVVRASLPGVLVENGLLIIREGDFEQ